MVSHVALDQSSVSDSNASVAERLNYIQLADYWNDMARDAEVGGSRCEMPSGDDGDLAFPLVFFAVVAREIVAGHNWRNLRMLAALATLHSCNLLVDLETLGGPGRAHAGDRPGTATLLILIASSADASCRASRASGSSRPLAGAVEPAPAFDRSYSH